jgi:hypothetical protein
MTFNTKVSREDVDAMYAYLKTVKPVKNAIDTNHLCFSDYPGSRAAKPRPIRVNATPSIPVPELVIELNRTRDRQCGRNLDATRL